MEVVDLLPVDLRRELRNLVESGFLGPPIEALAPVGRQFLEVIQGHATGEVGASVRRGIRPAGFVQSALEVLQLGVRDRRW